MVFWTNAPDMTPGATGRGTDNACRIAKRRRPLDDLIFARVWMRRSDQGSAMIELLDDIERAVNAKAYYLALMGALALPDICGCMEHADGIATPARYQAWFDKWVGASLRGDLSGKQCYQFRCNMLHQGATGHPHQPYTRIVFVIPGPNPWGTFGTMRADKVMHLNMLDFLNSMGVGMQKWMHTVRGTQPFETHLERVVRTHPMGIAGAIEGLPMIG
jgi:hypothetical protein